jgi:hypothetical protein
VTVLGLPDPEAEGIMFLQNVGNYSTNNTAPHSRRTVFRNTIVKSSNLAGLETV